MTTNKLLVEQVALAIGPDALRGPDGPLPTDPADDAHLPPELLALKETAERRLAEWQASGRGIGASSLADAAVFCSSGLGDVERHIADQVVDKPVRLLLADPFLLGVAIAGISELSSVER